MGNGSGPPLELAIATFVASQGVKGLRDAFLQLRLREQNNSSQPEYHWEGKDGNGSMKILAANAPFEIEQQMTFQETHLRN